MQAEDWQRLGLEAPTTDLLAIKRAYAARLKVTRPDDDAAAYQALRETYEWAQQWARWQLANEAASGALNDTASEPVNEAVNEAANLPASDPVDGVPREPGPAATTPSSSSAESPSPTAVPPATAARASVDAPMPPPSSPEALVDRAYGLWREQGDAALLAHWPELRARLEALPLGDLPEASARLADMVIHLPALPAAWVVEVERHFGWRSDFRTARLIGPQRAQALLATLDERIVRPITDESVLAQIEPLMRVARLAAAGRRSRALLHAVLGGGLLQGLYDALPAPQWRALGHDAVAQGAVRKLLGRALSLRVGAAIALIAALLSLSDRPVAEVVVLLGAGCFLALVAYPLSIAVAAWLAGWFGLRRQGTDFAARLRGWHAHPRRPFVGLGLLGAAVVAGAWAGGPAAPAVPVLPWLPWLVLTVVGAAALWPQDVRQGAVVVAGAAVGTFIAHGLLPADSASVGSPGAVALALGIAWALLASTVYERAWWGTREDRSIAKPQVWPFAPMINSLALCDRWGHRFAMAPVPLLVVLVGLGVIGATPWRVFIGWILLVLAFGVGQGLLFRWSERLAVHDDPTPPGPRP